MLSIMDPIPSYLHMQTSPLSRMLPFFSLDSCLSTYKHGAQSAAHKPPLAQTRNREAAFRRLCSTLTMRPHPRTWPVDFSNGVQTSKGVDELKSHVEGTMYKSDIVGPHGDPGQIRKPSAGPALPSCPLERASQAGMCAHVTSAGDLITMQV